MAPISGGHQEGDLSRERGADADQPRAEPVDRGRAQRLAGQREAEKQPQRHDEGDGDGVDRDALAGEAQRADGEGRVRDRRAALALGAEEHQPKTLHREMAADRSDQQHQHRGVRDRLKRDAVEKQADRGDDQQRQRDVDGDAALAAGEPRGQAEDTAGSTMLTAERARDQPAVQRLAADKNIEAKRNHAHRHREPRGAGKLARRQRGIGQRAIGDELALRNQDHPRDGEHQHQRQAEQRIDRAIGDAVLHQEQHDRRVQGRTLPLKERRSKMPAGRALWRPPGGPITAVEKACRI